MRLCERCKCTHRAFARHAAKRCFCHDHRVTERQRKQNVDQKENAAAVFCRKVRKSPNVAKTDRSAGRRQHEPELTREHAAITVMFHHYYHLFSANIQTQPPVKPFSPSASPACCINTFSIPHGPQKCNILLSQIHFAFSVYIMPYHRRCAFFTQSSATQPPALRRPQPFAEPTPALSSTTV